MTDAAVESLLGNLQHLLLHHTHLIKGAKEQVEKLEADLRLFVVFLRDTTKKRRNDERLRDLVDQIHDVVYEAEDIIDAFVTQAAVAKSQSYILRAFKTPVNLHNISTHVESVSNKVKEIYKGKGEIDLDSLNMGDGGPDKPFEVPRREGELARRFEDVVGFEDEAAKIIGYLLEDTPLLDVITVIGMPGLGKTTLVEKIFRDEKIQYEFPTRIWVSVSQEFTKKDIYLTILKEFTNIIDEMYRQKDGELAELVYSHLVKGKFLIVMDDVWTAEDWENIQTVLPKSNCTSKVLITSRNEEVALASNRRRRPHQLRFLTHHESWLLLQYEVFGKPPECPPELVDLGMLIADQCAGLPLAIVVIGGILAKKIAGIDDMNANRDEWMEVSKSVSTYINMNHSMRMENAIALSYHKLPYHLRACFLYFGLFPKDYPIRAMNLICMWNAEGFIQQKVGMSLEEIAENYLNELISMNLVRVYKRKPNGRVKTCLIHNILHDFCKNESRKENFLQEIKRTSVGLGPVDVIEKCRRFCIHSNVLNFFVSRPFGPRVRTFVCFSKEDLTLPVDYSSTIPAAFKLLRVLDIQPIKFTKIPSEMYQLLHLRYVTLSFALAVLPTAFDKLWNLETLIVDTSSRVLDIKANIWRMSKLRHIKTNASASLPKVGKSTEGEKLQTLGTVSPQSCTEEVFDRAKNLKKLGIRGELATLLVSFGNLEELNGLEKLELLNDVFPNPAFEGQLRGLPPPYQFPPKLKSLTLSDTFLDWSHMSTLGFLGNLEVLKLKNKAFMGDRWEAKDGGFRRLEVLHIGRTDLTFWVASHHHYPRLKHLELHDCMELKEIPLSLADVPTFRMLDLYRSNNAVNSAIDILNAKKEKLGEQIVKDGAFNLSIFPPVIN